MLDIDEITTHLVQFGAYELPRDVFVERSKQAMIIPATWLGNDFSSNIIREEIKQLRQQSESKNQTIRSVMSGERF